MRIDSETPWHPLLRLVEQDLKLRRKGGTSAPEAVSAWVEIVRRVNGYSAAIARTYSELNRQDAEDMAGALLLRMQDPTLVGRIAKVGAPAGYFYAMLRNAANDIIRRRRFKEVPLDDEQISQLLEESTQAGLNRSAKVEQLRDELLQLKAEDRRLLDLRFTRSLSIEAISQELGISFSATAVRLHRLIKKLKMRLGVE